MSAVLPKEQNETTSSFSLGKQLEALNVFGCLYEYGECTGLNVPHKNSITFSKNAVLIAFHLGEYDENGEFDIDWSDIFSGPCCYLNVVSWIKQQELDQCELKESVGIALLSGEYTIEAYNPKTKKTVKLCSGKRRDLNVETGKFEDVRCHILPNVRNGLFYGQSSGNIILDPATGFWHVVNRQFLTFLSVLRGITGSESKLDKKNALKGVGNKKLTYQGSFERFRKYILEQQYELYLKAISLNGKALEGDEVDSDQNEMDIFDDFITELKITVSCIKYHSSMLTGIFKFLVFMILNPNVIIHPDYPKHNMWGCDVGKVAEVYVPHRIQSDLMENEKFLLVEISPILSPKYTLTALDRYLEHCKRHRNQFTYQMLLHDEDSEV